MTFNICALLRWRNCLNVLVHAALSCFHSRAFKNSLPLPLGNFCVARLLTVRLFLFTCSVSRLWRNCARRVLRTQQHVAFVSASGASDSDTHVLCSNLAEEVEASHLLI